jgi:hypothetical protein
MHGVRIIGGMLGATFAVHAWAQALPPGVLVVNPGAASGGNGLAWATAFNNLQDAISFASGSGGAYGELWLAAGEYPVRQDAGGCVMPYDLAGIQAYGGFWGFETSREQRDPSGPASTFDGTAVPYLNERTCGPIFALQSGAALDRVRIVGAPVDLGVSAVRLSAGSAIRNSSIEGIAYRGSIVSATGSLQAPVVMEDCFIRGESARGTHFVATNTVLRRCDVWARSNAMSPRGMTADQVRIEDSRLRASGDYACIEGTSLEVWRSELRVGSSYTPDGIRVDTLVMRESRLIGYLPPGGFGASVLSLDARDSYFEAGYQTKQLKIRGTGSTVTNCRFVSTPSGFFSTQIQGEPGSAATFTSCTLQGQQFEPLLLVQVPNSNWSLRNCIVWGLGAGASYSQAAGVTNALQYCCVRGYLPSMGGVGNIATDPLLGSDGSLQAGSPCIDAGNNALLQPFQTYDLLGNCRVADGDGNGSFTVDMGAIEYTRCVANCDCSTNGPILTVGDFSCFLQRFAAGDAYANCDGSTQTPTLNVADFTCFLQRFAAGCP